LVEPKSRAWLRKFTRLIPEIAPVGWQRGTFQVLVNPRRKRWGKKLGRGSQGEKRLGTRH